MYAAVDDATITSTINPEIRSGSFRPSGSVRPSGSSTCGIRVRIEVRASGRLSAAKETTGRPEQ